MQAHFHIWASLQPSGWQPVAKGLSRLHCKAGPCIQGLDLVHSTCATGQAGLALLPGWRPQLVQH